MCRILTLSKLYGYHYRYYYMDIHVYDISIYLYGYIDIAEVKLVVMYVFENWRRTVDQSDNTSNAADFFVKMGVLWFLYARLKNGRIMLWQCPSVCPSVRPSVRPSFPAFFSTWFEISIWNLVYAFSRWHDMSSSSFITIGSFWPSL